MPTDGVFVDRLKEVVKTIARVGFPLPEFQTSFRESFLVDHSGLLFGLIALVVLIGVTLLVLSEPWILVSWLTAIGGLALIVGVSGIPMYGRHATVVHLTILATVWQWARRRTVNGSYGRPLYALAVLSLGVGVIGGSWAWITEIRAPFSSGAAATDFIRQRSDRSDVVVFCPRPSHLCATISIRLDTTLHYSSDDPGEYFYEFSRRSQNPHSNESVADEARKLANRLDVDVAVVEIPGKWDPVACRDRWEPSKPSITREDVTVCMLSDLLSTEISSAP